MATDVGSLALERLEHVARQKAVAQLRAEVTALTQQRDDLALIVESYEYGTDLWTAAELAALSEARARYHSEEEPPTFSAVSSDGEPIIIRYDHARGRMVEQSQNL